MGYELEMLTPQSEILTAVTFHRTYTKLPYLWKKMH